MTKRELKCLFFLVQKKSVYYFCHSIFKPKQRPVRGKRSNCTVYKKIAVHLRYFLFTQKPLLWLKRYCYACKRMKDLNVSICILKKMHMFVSHYNKIYASSCSGLVIDRCFFVYLCFQIVL